MVQRLLASQEAAHGLGRLGLHHLGGGGGRRKRGLRGAKGSLGTQAFHAVFFLAVMEKNRSDFFSMAARKKNCVEGLSSEARAKANTQLACMYMYIPLRGRCW